VAENTRKLRLISGFRPAADEIWALLRYYSAMSCSSLSKFRVNISRFLTPEDGTNKFPETSVQNYHSTLRNITEQRRSQCKLCEIGTMASPQICTCARARARAHTHTHTNTHTHTHTH
jgi:hypothetical protein